MSAVPIDDTVMALSHRTALPDELRVLLESYPRLGWASDPNLGPLAQFWLHRHELFRRMTERLHEDAVAFAQNRLEVKPFIHHLAEIGGFFINQLHEHHMVEDQRYFPALAEQDPRLAKGFALLDRDHQTLDALMDAFVDRANMILSLAPKDEEKVKELAPIFVEEFDALRKALFRHLEDEEDLVIPVLLKYGEP